MIEIFNEKEVIVTPRQGRKIFENKLLPFVKESLKTMDMVIIGEKNIRELFNISEKRAKFTSICAKMSYLTNLIDKNIKISRGTHNDGSNVIAFFYDNANK